MVRRRKVPLRSAGPRLRRWQWLAGVLVAGAVVPGEGSGAGAWEKLLSQSPFLVPGQAATPLPVGAPRLEFRGLVTMDQQTFFLIHDTARNRGTWLALGQVEDGITMVSHDPAADTVTVECQGQLHTLGWCAGKVRDTSPPADMPPVGVDLVPPRYIRNGLRNQSLHREEVEPQHRDNEWFREFVRKYGPPVYLEKP